MFPCTSLDTNECTVLMNCVKHVYEVLTNNFRTVTIFDFSLYFYVHQNAQIEISHKQYCYNLQNNDENCTHASVTSLKLLKS